MVFDTQRYIADLLESSRYTRVRRRGRRFCAMSYAIVRVGGKQYRVEKGDSIVVDRLSANEGDKVDLEPLLYADGDKSVLVPDELGKVKVQATVTGHERGKKIHGLKFKPKRGYKRRYGHRADLTRIEIADIKVGAARSAAKKEDADGS
jgi:large subunit ribosomal protein L21